MWPKITNFADCSNEIRIMNTSKRIFWTLAVALAVLTAAAQHSSTPYSRIGYGILADNATGIQRAMGGVGIAMQNGRQVNVINPASYSQVDSLTFLWDIGFDLSNNWSTEGSVKGYTFGGGLDYITSQFRLGKRVGASFGLVPYSNVGYSYDTEINNGSETRKGSGSLNELYVGVGVEPLKGLSVGANFSYLFGTLVNRTTIYSTSTNNFTREVQVRDWNVKVGLQYGVNIGPKGRLVLGATYMPRKAFHGRTWGTYIDATNDTKPDTLSRQSLKDGHQQPHTFGVGVSYSHNNRITAEADFTYQQWSKAKYEKLEGFEGTGMSLNDRWKAAAGVAVTPNPRGGYLSRITYRMGAFYNRDYISVQSNNVRDYGLTVGFSFPAPGSKTLINLGLEWRHRYSAPVALIKENYLNISLSVNFNELWFWKNKIR